MGKWRVPGLMCQGVLKDLRDKVVSAEHKLRGCLPAAEEADPMDEKEVETPAVTSDEKTRTTRENVLS